MIRKPVPTQDVIDWSMYIGIDFKSGGRNPLTGLDCWGLVRAVYKIEFNIDLPSFAGQYKDIKDKKINGIIGKETQENCWVKLKGREDVIAGDCVVFNINSLPFHVGIYVGGEKFMHCEEGVGCGVGRLTDMRWSKRIAGYYAHRELQKQRG